MRHTAGVASCYCVKLLPLSDQYVSLTVQWALQAKIVPESILQTCIKISNEPPSDMKSNMRRAFAAFSQEMCLR